MHWARKSCVLNKCSCIIDVPSVHGAQDIGVNSEFEKCVATLLVVSHSLNLLDASRACADFRDSNA